MTYRHDDDTNLRQRVVETIGNILIAAILGLMFTWVGINWVTGCGARV